MPFFIDPGAIYSPVLISFRSHMWVFIQLYLCWVLISIDLAVALTAPVQAVPAKIREKKCGNWRICGNRNEMWDGVGFSQISCHFSWHCIFEVAER